MSAALVSHTVASDTASDNSSTTPAIITTGASLLIAAVSWYSAAGTPVLTDSKSNTWAQGPSYGASGSGEVALFYCSTPTVGTAHTFTTTLASGYSSLCVAAFSGTSAGAIPDIYDGAGDASSPGSATPLYANELIITAFDFYSGGTASVDSGFTITDSLAAGSGMPFGTSLAYLVQGAAAAVNPTWTASSVVDPSAVMLSFQGSAPAPVTPSGAGAFFPFLAPSSTPSATAPSGSGPSGITMPTAAPASYTSGVAWSAPIFSDDFVTAVAAGAFPSNAAYSTKWDAYNGSADTSGAGTYETSILSVANSCLQMALGTSGGVVEVAAPLPILHGDGNAYNGQLYGRYDYCFKADSMPGFKTAWLLWPDSENWDDGEIDFPEGDLGATIGGNIHNVTGTPATNVASVSTSDYYTIWHVGTIEWSPSGVYFALDGTVLGGTANASGIPVSSMHFILQTETDGGAPSASVAGNVYVDWIAIYSLT